MPGTRSWFAVIIAVCAACFAFTLVGQAPRQAPAARVKSAPSARPLTGAFPTEEAPVRSLAELYDLCRPFLANSDMNALVALASAPEPPYKFSKMLKTPHTSLQLVDAPVCMKGNHFFGADSESFLGASSRENIVPEPLLHTNRTQVLMPLTERTIADYRDASSGGVVLEPRLAIMYTGQWSNVNLFHLINDILAGVGNVFSTYPELELVPRRVVYVVNSTFNIKWRKRHCKACSEWGDAFSSHSPRSQGCRDRPAEPTIVIDNLQPVNRPDQPLRCYCAAAVMHHHELPFHSKARSDAYFSVKRHLASWFGEQSYGTTPRNSQGFWEGCPEGEPRLLVIDRRGTRRLVQVNDLVNISQRVGFCVRTARFEDMSACEQFSASRFADVMMSVHGMALAAMLAMDGTAPIPDKAEVDSVDLDAALPSPARVPKSCRTVIELMHWVRPNEFWFYKEMAFVNNLTLVREMPVDVVFGRSVLKPEKEKKLLMKNTFWWGLKGFDDQTPIYDLASVERKLRYAFLRAMRCT